MIADPAGHRHRAGGCDRIVRLSILAEEVLGRIELGVLTVTLSGYDGNSTKLSKILLNGNNICMVRFGRFPLSLGSSC